jgi:hypothetical protein
VCLLKNYLEKQNSTSVVSAALCVKKCYTQKRASFSLYCQGSIVVKYDSQTHSAISKKKNLGLLCFFASKRRVEATKQQLMSTKVQITMTTKTTRKKDWKLKYRNARLSFSLSLTHTLSLFPFGCRLGLNNSPTYTSPRKNDNIFINCYTCRYTREFGRKWPKLID